jgi:hypothetical protein
LRDTTLGVSVNPEYYDPGDFVDTARDEAIEYMLNAINELRLIANCSKHADGDSCRELREKRPDLFVKKLWASGVEEDAQRAVVHRLVEEPLGSKGLYLSEDEFTAKVEAIKAFRVAFAETIRRY